MTFLNRIEVERDENDRRCARGGPRRPQRRLVAGREHDIHLARGKLAIGQFVPLDTWRLDVLERKIAARLVTEFGYAPLEGSIMRRPSRQDAGVADAEHLRLLRARRARQRRRRAAERG